MKKQTKEHHWKCCHCSKDCGVDPEVLVKQGTGVSAWSSFCSRECYFEAIKELVKNFNLNKKNKLKGG